jgi:two-component system, NarL family, response regulator NreC
MVASQNPRKSGEGGIRTHEAVTRPRAFQARSLSHSDTSPGARQRVSGVASVAAVAASEAQQDTIRIVLADDHAVVRSALRMLLESESDFEVVAEAGDVPSVVRFLRGHKPDVLILDLNMPGEQSLPAIPSMQNASPDTKIVVLTMQAEPAYARQALQAGVLGYVLKEAAESELVEAVRAASRGDTYLQPALGARLAAEPETEGPDDLTDREIEVLRLIALGHTNSEIAEQLSLSVRTVESHRAHIQQKVGHTARSELVRYALDHGLVDTG